MIRSKKLFDVLSYAYIKNVKRWLECPVCHEKMTFSKTSKSWFCQGCKYAITEEDFLDDFVFWFCDACNTYLNVQPGFDRKAESWVCTKCGFSNDISFSNLRGECKDCGSLPLNADAKICPKCKVTRLEKAKTILDASADLCFTLSNTIRLNESAHTSHPCTYNENYETEEIEMKCATCGNTDPNTLWDEGDTFHCSVCFHRTNVATGEDDVVECPYCHRMRDRKAAYCRYCNDSTWLESTPSEYAEIDSSLKEMGL